SPAGTPPSHLAERRNPSPPGGPDVQLRRAATPATVCEDVPPVAVTRAPPLRRPGPPFPQPLAQAGQREPRQPAPPNGPLDPGQIRDPHADRQPHFLRRFPSSSDRFGRKFGRPNSP